MRRVLTSLWLAVVLFAVPALGVAASRHARAVAEAAFAAGPRPVLARGAADLAAYCRSAGRAAGDPRCASLADLGLVEIASIAVAALGAALVLAVVAARLYAGDDRARLARVFAPLARAALWAVAAIMLVQGALLTLGVEVVSRALTGRGNLALIGVGFAALLGAWHVVAGARMLSAPLRARVLGRPVVAQGQPALWDFVRAVAARTGARPPAHLVLTARPDFFVTAADVAVDGNPMGLVGETMVLSVPLMRVLSHDELAAVIGHELAHFSGADTAYSLRFVPIYHGIAAARAGAQRATRGFDPLQLGVVPARVLLDFFIAVFAGAERRIGRARELEADRAGAALAGPQPLVAALLKCACADALWPRLLAAAARLLAQGRMLTNVADIVADTFARGGVEQRGAAASLLESRQVHPTDSHPSLAARAAALGVAAETLGDWCAVPASPAADLLAERDAVERVLNHDLHLHLLATGTARLPPTAA